MDAPEHLVAPIRLFGVHQRLQRLVLDHHRPGGAAGGVEIVGSHHRHRLPPEADLVGGENGLVGVLQAEPGASGNVSLGEDGVHTRQRQRRSDVDGDDAGTGVGAAHGRAPQHPLCFQVGGVGELPLQLGDGVGSGHRLADPPGHRRPLAGLGCEGHGACLPARRSKARRIAP